MIVLSVKDTKAWIDNIEITWAMSHVDLDMDLTPRDAGGKERLPGVEKVFVRQKGFCKSEDFGKFQDLLNDAEGHEYSFVKPIRNGALLYSVKIDSVTLTTEEPLPNLVAFNLIVESQNKPTRNRVNTF